MKTNRVSGQHQESAIRSIESLLHRRDVELSFVNLELDLSYLPGCELSVSQIVSRQVEISDPAKQDWPQRRLVEHKPSFRAHRLFGWISQRLFFQGAG